MPAGDAAGDFVVHILSSLSWGRGLLWDVRPSRIADLHRMATISGSKQGWP
jgi:hypothetical protein